MTRMFAFGPTAPPEYRHSRISIMMALYYLSRRAYDHPDIPETTQGLPGFVTFPYADANQATAAPFAERALPPATRPLQPAPPRQYDGNYNNFVCRFEPWIEKNKLSGKGWIVELLPQNIKAVLKLWEEDDETQKCNEVETYTKLEPLWGKCVPPFVARDVWEHSNSVVVEYVEVSFLMM